MANGDALTKARAKIATEGVGVKLLDGAAAVVDGPWTDVRTLRPGSIDLFGTFVGTVVIEGCNQDTQPLSSFAGHQIASLTSPSLTAVNMPMRWIRARVTAHTSGSINAFFHSTN
jgi:hypothetical protein